MTKEIQMISIPNFVESCHLHVGISKSTDDAPTTIFISQYSGALSFSHHMTSAQARMLAGALVDVANEIDGGAA